MTGKEILEDANLTDLEAKYAKDIMTKCCSQDWESGKNQFYYGVIAAIGYFKKHKLYEDIKQN